MSSLILEGLLKALNLIASGDRAVIEITLRSLLVSGMATLLASLWSIPLGALIGLREFSGRRMLRGLFNSLMGVPTVTLALLLYLLFSREGFLGFLRLLYTPMAMALGQSILITPIIICFVYNTLESVDREIRLLALTLGATERQAILKVLREAVGGLILAVTSGFNRAISELGVALMLGGNIRGATRVFTTAIALETSRGEFTLSLALALILLSVVALINLATSIVGRRL
jgi:tungstate transport system permease protein